MYPDQRTNAYEYDFLQTNTPFACTSANEACMRSIQCNDTCDAAMCEAIEDGFHLDKFNGISHASWVTYGSLTDEKLMHTTDTAKQFDLETRLSRALEERKERGEKSPGSHSGMSAPLPAPPAPPIAVPGDKLATVPPIAVPAKELAKDSPIAVPGRELAKDGAVQS